MAQWDSIWINANLASMTTGAGSYGAIRGGAIALRGDRIAWIGLEDDLPAPAERCAVDVHDARERWITPGLIDCHTHMVFGGNRAHEFEMRLEGASYEEIARAGGGIRSTVNATREASEDTLFASAASRLERLRAEGVTTMEVKSGYGLDTENELKMLRVARRLDAEYETAIVTTFLGAHAVPVEYEGRQSDYVALVCEEMLPAVAESGLADAVDAFCETIGFTPAETEKVFAGATRLGLPVKLHADQLSDQGGAALAARFKALSADHLEYASTDGVAEMAEAGTAAVLLPGAFYVLGETQPPPVAALREHGVPIAIATDCNPGSSPAVSLLLMLHMACTLFKLTPEETLAGITVNAARALGLADDMGTLEPGKRADLALWDIDEPAELCYWLGGNPCAGVVKDGQWLDRFAFGSDSDRAENPHRPLRYVSSRRRRHS